DHLSTLGVQTMCAKLEQEVDSRLTIRAERLWSFRSEQPSWKYVEKDTSDHLRFCDSVWQLLLKNVDFLSSAGQVVAHVPGKVGSAV
ncbi:MAG: hypothetical protein GY830_01450, partial [Bacteroidetes bacterium]|nr:hypothetical protein [Bacteroidota bacterium]